MSDTATLLYFLPRTYIVVSGASRTRTDLKTGKRSTTSTSGMALGCEADSDDYYELDLKGSGLVDTSFDLTLTEDGRLTTASATNTGRLGTVVKGVVSVLVTAAAVALRAGATGALSAKKEEPAKGEIKYETDHPKLAERLRRSDDLTNELTSRMLDLARNLHGDHIEEPTRRTVLREIYDIRSALRVVREEAALILRHRDAWAASRIGAVSEDFEFRLALSDLPSLEVVQQFSKDGKTPAASDLDPDAWRLYEKLQVVVAVNRGNVAAPRYLNLNGKPKLGSETKGILYRIPRRVEFVVFGHEGEAFVELSRSSHLVVDDNSWLSLVRFDDSVWGERSATIGFSDTGSLTKLAASASGAVANAAESIAALPEEISSALTMANKIIDEQQTLARQGLDETLTRLETERKTLEEQIALDKAFARQGLAGTLAGLDHEKQRLQAYKDIGELSRDLEIAPASGDLEARKEFEQLRKDLEQLQLDRLTIRQQFEEAELTGDAKLEKAITKLEKEIEDLKNGVLLEEVSAGG